MCAQHARQRELFSSYLPAGAGEEARHEHNQPRDTVNDGVEHGSILQRVLATAEYHRCPLYAEELYTQRLDTGRHRPCLAAICRILLPVWRQRGLLLRHGGTGPLGSGHPWIGGDHTPSDEPPPPPP